ncbi:hypothetical protein GQ457_04G034500 [Hibiscus cannabinus]
MYMTYVVVTSLSFFFTGNSASRQKSEGGLRVKNMQGWNKARMLLLLKNILASKGFLWMTWVKLYGLRSGDFWLTEGNSHVSLFLSNGDRRSKTRLKSKYNITAGRFANFRSKSRGDFIGFPLFFHFFLLIFSGMQVFDT